MLPMFRAFSISFLFALPQAPSNSPPPPVGGPTPPWAAVSIHVTPPDNKEWGSGDQPDGITMRGTDVRGLISQAYNFSVMPMRNDEITGLPDWARDTRYDILARVDAEDVPAFKKLTDLSIPETIAAFAARQYTGEMLMMQKLLADRFDFKMHMESRDRSVYTLVLAKGGAKLKPAADPKHGEMTFSQGHLEGKGVPVSFLASLLSQPLDRTVLDKTGLTGAYDFELKFQPQDKTPDATSNDPDLFTAVQEQLGLKLQGGHAPVPFMIVDHIEQPTAN